MNFCKDVYNLISFETSSDSYPIYCHCEEQSDEAIDTFVIASLNALAFRRGNLVFCYLCTIDRQSIFFLMRLPRLPHGRLAMTEGKIATPPLREARNDRGEDCHASLTGGSQ